MSQPRNVFHLFHSTGVGGAEIHLLQLAAAQRDQGWTPRVVTRADSWLAEQAVRDGFEVLPLRMRGFFDPASVVRLRRYVRRHRPSILHGHAMRGSDYARVGRRGCRSSALVMTAYSTNLWRHFDRASPVICVSGAVERPLRDQGLTRLVSSGPRS